MPPPSGWLLALAPPATEAVASTPGEPLAMVAAEAALLSLGCSVALALPEWLQSCAPVAVVR